MRGTRTEPLTSAQPAEPLAATKLSHGRLIMGCRCSSSTKATSSKDTGTGTAAPTGYKLLRTDLKAGQIVQVPNGNQMLVGDDGVTLVIRRGRPFTVNSASWKTQVCLRAFFPPQLTSTAAWAGVRQRGRRTHLQRLRAVRGCNYGIPRVEGRHTLGVCLVEPKD